VDKYLIKQLVAKLMLDGEIVDLQNGVFGWKNIVLKVAV